MPLGDRPRASPSGSMTGWSSWSIWRGSTRRSASSFVMSFSFTMSTAILTAAGRGALPVARLEHVQLVLLDGELEVLHVPVMLLELRGDLAQLLVDLRDLLLQVADRVRGPDAGDDVFALRVHRDTRRRTPSRPWTGLRVKPTPVAESSPMLPNTIAWTLTAVPMSSGIPFDLPVVVRPVVVPRPEHGVARHPAGPAGPAGTPSSGPP